MPGLRSGPRQYTSSFVSASRVIARRRVWGVAATVCGLVVVGLGASRADAQQQVATGGVAGAVIDASSKAPIPDAQVLIVGTTHVTRTQANGRFRLINIPVGAQRVQVFRLGYATTTRAVTITEGTIASVDFVLGEASVALDRVVVTAPTGQAEQAKVNGNTIGLIELDSVPKAAVTDFSDVLNSRVPGLTVIQNSGTVGTGSRIYIRGIGSAALSNQPLIVIDGVRAYNDVAGISGTIGLGGQGTSRFDDLDFEDIESVEVLKGPAAAALYGTQAASGVLVITTKHGQTGEAPTWHWFGQLGRLNNVADFPSVWSRPAAGGGQCSLIQEYSDECVGATGTGDSTPGTQYNVIKNSPGFFVKGYDEATGASVEGGSPLMTYHSGVNWDRQQGVYETNYDRKTHVNSAFNVHPIDQMDLGFSVEYTQRRIDLPLGDNAIGGPLSGALLGGSGPNEFFFDLGPTATNQINNYENVDRYTMAGNGVLRLLPWLSLRGTAGFDYLSQFDYFYLGRFVSALLAPTGSAAAINNDIWEYTGDASIVAKYPIPIVPKLSGTTTFGGEWIDYSLHGVSGAGTGLLPGTGSLAGASTNITAFETNQDIVNIGGYLREELAWRNVLFANASIREDGNSAFGHNQSTAWYPSGALSYVISDEAFWPRQDYISSLRLRIAGGQSGREPIFRLAEGTYTSGAYNLQNAGSVVGLVPNSIGDANLKPERSTEYEAGFDAGFWKERVTFTATAYDRTERDLITAQPVDISTGQTSEPSNIGVIDNRGLEFNAGANIFTSRYVAFHMDASLYVERNKLVSTGGLPAALEASGVTGNGIQYDMAGAPLGVFMAIPYTYSDKHHDGVITPDDITYGTKPVQIGEPGPRDEITVSPTITLFKYLTISALFDRRDGITVYDGGDAFECLNPFQSGRECNDPHAPQSWQAAAVAMNSASYGGPGTDYGYILNASFWKWRELSFKLSAPDSYVHRFLAGHAASLTISGRNLATWTPYRGLDPEISQNGSGVTAGVPIVNSQFFTQPPLRSWIARIDLTW
jgi:TonB-dependent starch-binding outer membrane protein SusC